jgi:hypothetical protein
MSRNYQRTVESLHGHKECSLHCEEGESQTLLWSGSLGQGGGVTYEYQTKAANCMITRIRDMIKFLSYREKSKSVLVKPGTFFRIIKYQYREHQGDDE